MKIFVKTKPKAKTGKVEKIDDNNFAVWVQEAPEDGKANKAVIKLLAKYFDVPQSNISIIVGHSSRKKIAEIVGI